MLHFQFTFIVPKIFIKKKIDNKLLYIDYVTKNRK